MCAFETDMNPLTRFGSLPVIWTPGLYGSALNIM
jgi:hypothetical protein